MRKYVLLILAFLFLIFSEKLVMAQQEQTGTVGERLENVSTSDSTKIFVITKNDGTRFVGKIIQQDAREVLIETENLGQVFVPRHELKEIREIRQGEVLQTGVFMPSEVFSTRYFITTNGLPVKKGDTYILWSLFGPDFQFGIGENLGVGVLSTWLLSPIIGSIKYSIPIDKSWNSGLGLLVGTGSWGMPGFAMALPYGVITYGDRVKNLNLSMGYGGVRYKDSSTNVSESEGNFLFSVAGMVRLTPKVSLVFDSFIIPRSGSYKETYTEYIYDPQVGYDVPSTRIRTVERKSIALFMPGLRFQTRPTRAIQVGFAGARVDGETFPVPMVQWFQLLD